VTPSATTIQLTANGHYAAYFNQLFPGQGAVQGSIVLSAAPTAISAVTLRNNWAPIGWSSLPVTPGAYQTEGSTVVQDGAASNNVQATATTLSVYHTTGAGPNPLTLVSVAWNDNTTTYTLSSVAFTPDDGGTPVDLASVITQANSNGNRFAAIYSLTNPPVGQSGTVTATFSGSVPSGAVIGAVNFANVNQTTPLGTPTGAGASATGTAPSVTVTGLTGNELVMDTLFMGGTTPSGQTMTPGAGMTPVWTNWAGNTRSEASISQASSSSVTMSYTAPTAAQWAIAAVPINPAP